MVVLSFKTLSKNSFSILVSPALQLLTAFAIGAAEAERAVAFVGVVGTNASASILAWADHLAEVSF